jgi:diguanylate cyclase (GGDEF)-like protein
MKKINIIYIQIAALFIFIAVSLVILPSPETVNTNTGLNDCVLYNDGWTISTEAGSRTFATLPTAYRTDNESDVWLTKTITGIENGDCIGFFSFQQQVTVYINGNPVYNFVPDEGSKSLTPGNKWNFVRLTDVDGVCEVSIHIYECYSSSRISIPSIYYGTQSGILLKYLKYESLQLLVSILMIMFGVILGLFCLMYRKKTGFERTLAWLALFAVFRGTWTLIEANVYSFFFDKLLFLSQLSYMSLKLATVTFLQFVNTSFHKGKSRTIKVLVIISSIDFWLSIFCQYILGIDFARTVFITHLILLVGGIYACTSSLKIARHIGADNQEEASRELLFNRRNSYIAHVMCSIAIVATSLIDLVRYYVSNSPDVAKFSRWGDLIYVTVVSISLFLNFVNLLRMGHQAAQIREEAAIDPLTKLLNRATFEHDIAQISSKQLSNSGIAMLDLNNLKHFNDVHGHGMGDYYIIISSEIIKDAFSSCGTVYRIGGDEFCIITENLSIEDFMKIREHIEDYMGTLKMPSSDLHMGISAGFAQFNPSLDHTLRDTMKRADELMYQRKIELKKHRY